MSDEEQTGTSAVAPGTITALLRKVALSPIDENAPLPILRPGQVVGRFELVREIGRGGFGVVYEARDRELGRAVALKAVRMGGNIALKQERLLREAEAAAQLAHPNIVTLHDMGRFDHGPYLVMELLRGASLAARLQEGATAVGEALQIAEEVAKALAHAHANGVVHRDLTPGNVFLCRDGQVKVLDFGMAQAFGRPKLDGGTRAYMAPEQCRGEPEDERTDVFALGVILHQMISGKVPFADAHALTAADGPPPLKLRDGAPVADLVARMLAKAADARPRDGREVLAALAATRAALERAASAEAASRPRTRPGRRVALLLAAVLPLTVAGALALAHRPSGDREPAAPPPASAAAPDPSPPRGPSPAALAAAAPAPARPRPLPEAKATVRPAAARGAVRECRDTINAVPTPSPGSGDGVLTVEAEPFGAVFVNGRPYGETPAECRVSAATYAVRAVHPTYGARESRVEVRAGARTRWTADFLGER